MAALVLGSKPVAGLRSGPSRRWSRRHAKWGSAGSRAAGCIARGGDSIHGTRAVLTWAHKRDDAKSRWVLGLKARRGMNRAVVAYANKLARIGWAVLRHGEVYDVDKAFRAPAPRQMRAAA
jgi:transposase